MNVYDKMVVDKELTNVEFRDLADVRLQCPVRYGYYRRHYPLESREWCIESAKSWGENTLEQQDRRKDHETGAT